MAAPAMTAPPAERPGLRLADGCWVGRSGGTVLMAVGGEYFAAESPAAADAIEERLRTAGPGDVDPASEALVALGLLTAEPPGPAVTGGQLAGTVLGLLRDELAGNVLSTAQEIRDGALAPIPAEAVRHIDDHAAYYLSPAAGGALDFLSRPGGQARAPGPRAGEPHDVIPACLAAGLRIATCDITPADVAACGLRVVRAVSPDLAPLWFGWHREPAGHPRLRCPRPNRAPHPFR
jgi:hypothetical protein